MAHEPIDPVGCWGSLSKWGWDGICHYVTGDCYKKPRPGCLTCWWHRFQEHEAKKLKAKIEVEAKEEADL